MSPNAVQAVPAIYRNGTLTLLDALDLPEGANVQVAVRFTPMDAVPFAPRVPRTVPARRLAALVGVASLGGDALSDSEALYDADWD